MRAYIAVVQALTGVLLGGNKEHRSSPFASREDAERWAEAVVRGNREAGRQVGTTRILAVMAARSQVIKA